MLNGIHLVDYGNHRDTRLTFGRMTALVGQNGAGKTNLLRGIMEVRNSIFGGIDKGIGEENRTVRSGMAEWIISTSWSELSLSQSPTQIGTWAVRTGSQKESMWLWRADTEEHKTWLPSPYTFSEEFPHWVERTSRFSTLRGSVTGLLSPGTIVYPEGRSMGSGWSSQYFKTAGSYLQGPSYSELPIPVLSEDCHDLAWMIAYLKGDKDEVFADITGALREVVPTFRRVRHRPAPVSRIEKKEVVINKIPRLYDDPQTVMGQELRFDMASGLELPASAISEGTLITLAILTAIIHDDSVQGAGVKTVLLDDIESGLHPSAQRDLIRQLHRLQETRPELQIIFSSHSPYIIDEMKPEDVWLFAPDKEGIAHCAKLSDHPDAKRALEVLTTGEFWSAEGEGWVLDRAKQSNEEAVAAN